MCDNDQEDISDLERKFLEFHRENPHIYKLVVKYAWDAKDAGFLHYSIAGIFERIRWHTNVETREPEGFKLNNNHKAYYARLVMKNQPGLKGFFRLKPNKTEQQFGEQQDNEV